MTRKQLENAAWEIAEKAVELAEEKGLSLSAKGVAEDLFDRLEVSNDIEDEG